MAEISRLFTKCARLHCVSLGVGLRAWHELERRGSRLGARDGVDDVGGVAAVLRSIGNIEIVVDGVDGVYEGDVFLDAVGANVARRPRAPRNQEAPRP